MTTKPTTGVLLVNLGTPDAPTRSAVYRYLKQFLSDPRVIDVPFVRRIVMPFFVVPFRAGESAKGYQKLWMQEGSPLKVYGYRLAEGVQKLLGDDYQVELAMRYQSPSIAAAVKKLMDARVANIVVLPLFPQYASASTGSVQEEVMRVLSQYWNVPALRMIDQFCDYPPMIDVFAERGRQYDIDTFDHILFSYHGLPERQITKGDTCNHCFKPGCCQTLSDRNRRCYKAHCMATTRAIAAVLNLSDDRYTVCFQSRLGRDPWVQPYTSDVIEQLAAKGHKRMLVFCPAFVCDCLETTVEISDEYQEIFQHKGGEVLQLVEGLNDHPAWIKAVAGLVRQ